MKFIIPFAFAIFLGACASTHPGKPVVATNRDIPMIVSARNMESSFNLTYQLIEVTIENTSENWLRIAKAEAVIDPKADRLSVVVGQDLRDWAKAVDFRNRKDANNQGLAQVALIGAGAVIAGASGDSSGGQALGAAAMLGGYAWASTDVIKTMQSESMNAKQTPENHLYTSFSVPGKMFIRRWILFNKPPKTDLHRIVVNFETAEGKKDVIAVTL